MCTSNVLIPALFMQMQHTKFDWHHYSEVSNVSSLSFKNGTVWIHGKMLGATGSINGNAYIRGNERDYNQWAEMGNPTWSLLKVLEYFKKSESNTYECFANDTKYYGSNGPQKITYYNSNETMINILTECINSLGIKHQEDYNRGVNLGYTIAQGTVYGGRRWSTAKSHLIPAAFLTNLHIIKHAHVTKINFQPYNKQVSGVTFTIRNNNDADNALTAMVSKEVILSAGAVNSPQIFMLSGIGERMQLEKFGSDVIQDSPFVGKNLQDHAAVSLFLTLSNTQDTPKSLEEMIEETFMYAMRMNGELSTISTTEYIGFVDTFNNSKYPNIQYHNFYLQRGLSNTSNVVKSIAYNDDIIDQLHEINKQLDMVMFTICLLNPKSRKSRGQIDLRSKNPYDSPKIFTNYLTDPDDVKEIISGIRILYNLENSSAFKSHGGNIVRLNITNCQSLKYNSDKYWECYSRHLITTIYHPVGTVKIGPSSDSRSVVDSTLNVHDVKGLRVADASIMPLIPIGNTNAPTIMIGEKVADFIKDDWNIS